jgi:hypothetical protein
MVVAGSAQDVLGFLCDLCEDSASSAVKGFSSFGKNCCCETANGEAFNRRGRRVFAEIAEKS